MSTWIRAGLLLFLVASPADAQEEGSLDIRILRSVNALQDPAGNGIIEYLDISSIPTFVAFPVGFSIIGLAASDRIVFETGLLSLTAQAAAQGLTLALKELSQRPRPFDTLTGVAVKHRWSAPGYSFPSGHTSQAFAIATILSLQFPKGSVIIPAMVWATAVGFGRIFLGLHYPSDVLGGILVGIGSGYIAWQLRPEAGRIAERAIPEPRLTETGIVQPALFSLKIRL